MSMYKYLLPSAMYVCLSLPPSRSTSLSIHIAESNTLSTRGEVGGVTRGLQKYMFETLSFVMH